MRLRFLGMKCRKIEKLITIVDNRNRNLMKYPTLGINKDKDFMPTVANMEGVDTSKYKLYKIVHLYSLECRRDATCVYV